MMMIVVVVVVMLPWSDDRITRETLSNNNPCPSSPSSTIYIYIYSYWITLIIKKWKEHHKSITAFHIKLENP